MRCEQVERLLIDYLEGELGETEASAVREHIAECMACAGEVAAFESTRELLRNDAYVEPSPFYWTRFNARLRQRMRRGAWAGADDRWGVLVPRLAPVAVAVSDDDVPMAAPAAARAEGDGPDDVPMASPVSAPED